MLNGLPISSKVLLNQIIGERKGITPGAIGLSRNDLSLRGCDIREGCRGRNETYGTLCSVPAHCWSNFRVAAYTWNFKSVNIACR